MPKQNGKELATRDNNNKVATTFSALAQRRQAATGENIENPRSIINQGLIIIFIFFGVLGVWSVIGHIHGAVVAQGIIKIETERKTVQHLEGGIVEDILIHEGDEVKEGQTLIILSSVEVDANANMLQKQLIAQEAQLCRLNAEKDLKKSFQWPEDLRQRAAESNNSEVLDNEEKIFITRRDSLQAQISLFNSQIAQLDAQVLGQNEQLKAEKTIIRTLQEELQAKRQLFKERYLEKSQILELERNLAAHEGSRGNLLQSIAQAKQRRAELNLHIVDTKGRFIEEVTKSIGQLENDIIQTKERIRPLKDARNRLQISAPVAGRVVDLKVHSIGGVVRGGEALMDIVPHDNPLIVETQVPVNKITDVYAGQDALVQLDAFDTRITPNIPGQVTYVSADRLEEGPTGVPYYLCYVEVDPKALAEADLYISPGMPVTVFITTKETTVLYYIFSPIVKNWNRALRD